MGVSVAIGVGIGALVGGGAAAIQSGGNFDAIWKGALVGAVGGAVGGWAAPALTGALGGTLGGMAAGGLGGVTAGVLGTALNGGNSSDYLKNGLFGGLGGAALGGLTGGASEMFGGQSAPVNGGETSNMVTGTPYTSDVTGATTPLTDAGASTLNASPTASGIGGGNVNAADVVNASVTGSSGSTPNAAAGLESLTSGTTNPSVMTPGVEAPAGSFGTSFDTANSPMQWGSDISYDGPHVPSSNSNTADPFEMGKAWSAPQSQVESQLAPYAAENAAQNKLMWQGGNNNQPGFFDQLFSKKTGGDMIGKLMGGQMMGQALKGVGSVAGMNEARQNKQQLMDLYNTQLNQYNTQNAAANQYQTQLQNTYNDPNAYLNSPEAEATRQQAMQKLLAQNAMAGRRTAGLAMQNQLMQNQLSNLAAYRQGLRNNVNYASPTGLGTVLNSAQAQSPQGNLFAGLGSMFAPAATYYMMMPNG